MSPNPPKPGAVDPVERARVALARYGPGEAPTAVVMLCECIHYSVMAYETSEPRAVDVPTLIRTLGDVSAACVRAIAEAIHVRGNLQTARDAYALVIQQRDEALAELERLRAAPRKDP